MADPIQIALQANIQWRATQSPTSKRWIGICDPMNLSMEADSLDELHSIVGETLQFVLADLLHDNELDAYLRERGWQVIGQQPIATNAKVHFQVPWELVVRDAGDSPRSANQ